MRDLLNMMTSALAHVLTCIACWLVMADALYSTATIISSLTIISMALPAQVHRHGVTPLHIAAAIGSPELMLAMLSSTQERNLEFETGIRVSRNKPPPPPDINIKDGRGRCALHVAAAAGAEACAVMLIQAAAAIDAVDADKITPLAMACACGQKNVVAALIKAGTRFQRYCQPFYFPDNLSKVQV